MLSAWSAFPALDRLLEDVMNDVSGKAFGSAPAESAYTPAIDVRADSDAVTLVCDVPGVKSEDLELTIEGGVLTIKGRRRYEGNETDRVLVGRRYGAFTNEFALPDYVDAERMTADLADGVLTVTLPRQPAARPRRIEIGSARAPKQLGDKST